MKTITAYIIGILTAAASSAWMIAQIVPQRTYTNQAGRVFPLRSPQDPAQTNLIARPVPDTVSLSLEEARLLEIRQKRDAEDLLSLQGTNATTAPVTPATVQFHPNGLTLTSRAGGTNMIQYLTHDSETGYAEFVGTEDMVNKLAANGAICQVLGHQWAPYRGMIAIHAINPPPPTPILRTCSLCKRTEQQISNWLEVTVDQMGTITPK